ncbi:XtrA/YqaO family protein [Aquibacillus rhizosphaerae]|uniref:XtrA/YqaO family protein n=1 Tax=Aquibacillus rhizosphaerae TaxID=3051431 RepID=A0ABT7LAB2_9BACI|nr:XtrA/YqaO family protein [Aquibacillus sp. LR5S19]MDL4842817.1 XtrA/YqaO family protein [Aquibacillus sp. LR5S19]
MRLNSLPLEINDKKIQIDVDLEGNRPFCVVYCEGQAKFTYLPDHGETRVITHQGKVKRVKFDEGEEF